MTSLFYSLIDRLRWYNDFFSTKVSQNHLRNMAKEKMLTAEEELSFYRDQGKKYIENIDPLYG